MYFPVDDNSGYASSLNYVIRTAGDPEALVPTVRATLRSIDSQLAIVQCSPWTSSSIDRRRSSCGDFPFT